MSDLALWNEYVSLEQECLALKDHLTEALGALREAAAYTRHPDYDWPVEFSRHVDAMLAARGRNDAG